MHRRARRELFFPRGLRAYQDGNDLSDWISGRTVDRAVILCAAEECGGVLLHRTTSRFANFGSAGRPGRICPRGHCVPAHRMAVGSIRRPPTQLGQLQLWFGPHVPTGADGFATQTTGRHRPGGAETLLRGQVRACPPCGSGQHWEAPQAGWLRAPSALPSPPLGRTTPTGTCIGTL